MIVRMQLKIVYTSTFIKSVQTERPNDINLSINFFKIIFTLKLFTIQFKLNGFLYMTYICLLECQESHVTGLKVSFSSLIFV